MGDLAAQRAKFGTQRAHGLVGIPQGVRLGLDLALGIATRHPLTHGRLAHLACKAAHLAFELRRRGVRRRCGDGRLFGRGWCARGAHARDPAARRCDDEAEHLQVHKGTTREGVVRRGGRWNKLRRRSAFCRWLPRRVVGLVASHAAATAGRARPVRGRSRAGNDNARRLESPQRA